MSDNLLSQELKDIQFAYSQKNWDKIEALVHKMKSGAVYCGTKRLNNACKNLEFYKKLGHSELLEALYHQFCVTVEHTKTSIEKWLIQQSL